MHTAVKRVVLYIVVAAVLYAIAMFFAPNQLTFALLFGIGFLIALTADLMFLTHLVRLPWKRRQR